jgi:hypothetical protein
MIQNFPRPVHPKINKQTDDQIAKVGQLNQLVRDINQLQTDPSSPTGIPFEWYPPAGLTNAGPKFTYTDGVELISYHIKGIYQLGDNPANSFSQYLCTVSISAGYGLPGIFPGNLTGMFVSGTGNDIITSPLAIGGLIEINGVHVPLTGLAFSLYYYNDNPQPDGSYWYALVAEGNTTAVPGDLTALMSYDFEMLMPNFVPAPTILQD